MAAHRRFAVVSVIAACAGAAIAAQSEKVSLNMMPPRPGTVRYQITQDIAMDVAPDGQGDASPQAMKMTAKNSMRLTQQTGEPDEAGRIEVKMTYDEMKMAVALNGRQTQNVTANPLDGKTLVAAYSADGHLLSMTGPPGTDAFLGPTRQALEQMMGMWSVQLAVGDSQTMPMSMQLPIPIPGADNMKMKGETTIHLASIDVEEGNRIASCDSRFKVTLNQTIDRSDSGTPAGLTVDLKMIGTGASKLDLDRRVVRMNDGTINVDGAILIQSDPSGAMRLNLRGVVKMLFAEIR